MIICKYASINSTTKKIRRQKSLSIQTANNCEAPVGKRFLCKEEYVNVAVQMATSHFIRQIISAKVFETLYNHNRCLCAKRSPHCIT